MNLSPILKTVSWPDEAATENFAQTLAKRLTHLGLDGCIALHGELGAGKTTFVRHLLRALGVSGRIKSPTYAVVEPYEVEGLHIWHFDFYRFSDPNEWEDAGFRDIFASKGLKICEWPDKAAGFLPTPDVDIRLQVHHDDSRTIELKNAPLIRQTNQNFFSRGSSGVEWRQISHLKLQIADFRLETCH